MLCIELYCKTSYTINENENIKKNKIFAGKYIIWL